MRLRRCRRKKTKREKLPSHDIVCIKCHASVTSQCNFPVCLVSTREAVGLFFPPRLVLVYLTFTEGCEVARKFFSFPSNDSVWPSRFFFPLCTDKTRMGCNDREHWHIQQIIHYPWRAASIEMAMRAGVQSLNYKKSYSQDIGCPLTLPSPTNHQLLAYCRMLDSENQ